MPAVSVRQKPQALTGALPAPPDADMIERPQAELMHCETAAADLATDFVKGVVGRLAPDADAEDADPIAGRRAHQADQALGSCGFGHGSIIALARVGEQAGRFLP